MALVIKSDGAGGGSENRRQINLYGTASVTLNSHKGLQDVWFNGVHYQLDYGSAMVVPIPVQQILSDSPIT